MQIEYKSSSVDEYLRSFEPIIQKNSLDGNRYNVLIYEYCEVNTLGKDEYFGNLRLNKQKSVIDR